MLIIILFIVLFFLMAMIGGNRGATSFIVLIFNVLIGLGSSFLIGYGCNAFVIMIISSLLFSLNTIIFQNNYNIKTAASFLSVLIIMIMVSSIIYFICVRAHISGLNEIQLQDEVNEFITSAVSLNMMHVLIVSMIWGELGAVTDTSISISSALHEIAVNNPERPIGSLIRSGIMIGKDILGTTVNTLFFVAVSESIMLSLFYLNNQYTVEKLINSKSFFQEISGVLFSCIGCVLIIPVTAIIFSVFIRSPRISERFQVQKGKNEAGA